jgi:glycerol-3-phosphate dehydrogenase
VEPAEPRLDVLILGGGVAGLWILDRLHRAGLTALLLEAQGLGHGQTIQSQGIIHGGGKYALRGVRDFSAVAAIREMPERWRRHLQGREAPDLSAAKLLSQDCLLWLPRRSLVARVQALGIMPVVARAGLLATRPRRVPRPQWPAPLPGSAAAVYRMAEPVVDTSSLLAALAEPHRDRIRSYACGPGAAWVDVVRAERTGGGGGPPWLAVRARSHPGAPPTELRPRAVVLAAGAGNADLLARAGEDPGRMQRRPLCMVLLRGALPPLYAHCVVGGKTRLTVTAVDYQGETVWQVGGELAERHAYSQDHSLVQRDALAELRRWLPALDQRGLRIATYAATRAEARDARGRRPSGVHVERVGPNAVVAWPTKLALAPLLAEEVLGEVDRALGATAARSPATPLASSASGRPTAAATALEAMACATTPAWSAWPSPPIARPPWEEATWSDVR